MADWNSVAIDSYAAASLLVEQDRWRSAVSRAYYAVYARVAAELRKLGVQMPMGREGPSHARLPDVIEGNLRALGGSRWRVSSLVQRLYHLRVMADYQPSGKVRLADARNAAQSMAEVFRLMRGER